MATDIFNPKGHNYLFIVDFYTKYPFILKLREFSSQEVISLTKQIFAKQGILERFISDNGLHFSSHCFKEFAKLWDFECITLSPRYPQMNGMSEWFIQTVKLAMKKAMLSNQDIDMSLLCLWSTPIDHIIPSPEELLYNWKLVCNFPAKCTNNNAWKEKI